MSFSQKIDALVPHVDPEGLLLLKEIGNELTHYLPDTKYNDILEKRSKTFQKELKAQTDAQARVMARQDRTFAQNADATKGGMGSLRSPLGILDLLRGKAGGIEDIGRNQVIEHSREGRRGIESHISLQCSELVCLNQV